MNLLRVIASMDPSSGGPCQGIRNSMEALTQLGVHVEIASLDGPNAGFIEKDDFPIHALGPAKGPWKYNARLEAWLLDNLERFDAVIVHGLWLYNGYAVHKALKKLKKRPGARVPKLYVMPHGMLDPYFQKASSRELKAARNVIYWKWIESNLVNEADGVLFTCQAELELARLPFKPYKPKAELNVGYGIAEPPARAWIDKNPGPYPGNKPYLLFLSRIHDKKGVDLLIKAYTQLKEEGYALPGLLVAGPGLDTSYGLLVRDMAKGDDDILFPGMLSGSAKWAAFHNCEAFILPSHQENFGIAVVEALACGKPVLISNQVNIWREISNETAGIIEEDTLEGTRRMLESWISLPPDKKQEMSLQARRSYTKYFKVESAARHMLSAINPYK